MGQQRETNEQRYIPLGSAPVGMDWDSQAAAADVIMASNHRALTLPAQHDSSRAGFNGAGINTGHAPTSMPVSGGEDRLTVNWAEWRKGYSYLVEVPQNQAPSGLLRTRDRDMLSPRELLDQSGSNDFSAYKEIQELKDGGGMLSPTLASSPFAKQTHQPFADNASCRSRLSDYGFTSESEDEQDWDCHYGEGHDWETPVKGGSPAEGCGFWAEVGATGGSQSTSMNHEVSCDTHFRLQQQAPTPAKGAPETPQVVWEVNEWESASDYSKPSPVCPERPASQHAAPIQEEPSPKKQAVLLPWDLM